MTNTALDLVGRARMLLTYAGEVEGEGRTEDDLAYFRSEREFRNFQIMELPGGLILPSPWPGSSSLMRMIISITRHCNTPLIPPCPVLRQKP